MLIVHVVVKVKASDVDAFVAATKVNAAASRQEPGVVRFDLLGDRLDAASFLLVEVYRDEDAAKAHKATAHYATWRDTVEPMMASPRTSVRYADLFPAA